MRFCDLVERIKSLDRPNWFGNKLLVALFITHWPKTRNQIIRKGLIPFTLYFLISLVFTQKLGVTEY